ncbi:MAG TPA: enoyl-CoA hydratase-related protein [Myxococcota bacterium]|nr:enoyl-CoA hydratase-related protein [Myxococcota bacterium]
MTVRSEDRDGVRVLSLARPPVNALVFALVRARGAACESAADAPCTALVLTGIPGVFSAGIDTKRLAVYDARVAASGAFRLGLTEAAAAGVPFPAGPLSRSGPSQRSVRLIPIAS